MIPLLIDIASARGLAETLCAEHRFEAAPIERRQFPDGESYVRLDARVAGRHVVMLCTLDRPDDKALPLIFAAEAARAQGALSVGLAAPYLAYMRQDRAFRAGEAVTSRSFAALLSRTFDWLATVDPHLHRLAGLDSVYSIPAVAATARGPIADWIARHAERPFLIGPDRESAQWVGHIAGLVESSWAVFDKVRSGDLEVALSGGPQAVPAGAQPVLVDDIASSARTMIAAVESLRRMGAPVPICLVVHAVFAGDAHERLLAAGPARIVSTNTVDHPTNEIDIAPPLVDAITECLRQMDTS
jgi:ribose-phosphate pyrophosphokinase